QDPGPGGGGARAPALAGHRRRAGARAPGAGPDRPVRRAGRCRRNGESMMLGAIDVRELLGHPGASRQEPVRGTVDGLATELARVPDDEPVAGDLLLES